MSRGRVSFKQRDFVRALRGTARAGLRAQRVEIDREGRIVVCFGRPEQQHDAEGNEWDSV
jgi:hypothetical protein